MVSSLDETQQLSIHLPDRVSPGYSTMKITLFTSTLCPRCYMARKHLFEVLHGHGGVTVEEVDILGSPLKSWQQGIRMIPAVKIDGDILSAAYLTRQQIADFTDSHLEAEKKHSSPNS